MFTILKHYVNIAMNNNMLKLLKSFLVMQVIIPTELEMNQIRSGEAPRREQRHDRQKRLERLQNYEEKLLSGVWTPTKFLEASSFLCKDFRIPTDEELQELIEVINIF